MKINELEYNVGSLEHDADENVYTVAIGTGLVWACQFHVVARNEQEAVDLVVDYMVENEIKLYMNYNELEEKCDNGETVEEYAENNNLVSAGNNSYYINLLGINL